MKSHYRGEKEVTQCTNWCYNKLRTRNKYTIFKGKKCKFYSDTVVGMPKARCGRSFCKTSRITLFDTGQRFRRGVSPNMQS